MSTGKTPGVSVEEISGPPPSVVEVETAIPAFVGHTQKASKANDNDLVNTSTLITSVREFEQYFGDAATEFYPLYFALQLFYDNGGGKCFVVSVGKRTSPAAPDVNALNAGLDAVSAECDVTLLVVPEMTELTRDDYATLAAAMLAQCGRLKNRFAIFDLIDGANPNADFKAARDAFGDTPDLKYGAAYYPFVRTTSSEHRLTLPASGAIAGVYAATDRARGVWKAPANVSLADVIAPAVEIDNQAQEGLNVDASTGKSINAIRAFPGKGTLVWGARTLAGNDNEWRYISVRRFVIMVEESVRKSTQWAVFEPNDANTWGKIRGMIERYLTDKWRAGALFGPTSKEAFFVNCGLGITMTAQDILAGRLKFEIGMAVVRPGEFIIVEISHQLET